LVAWNGDNTAENVAKPAAFERNISSLYKLLGVVITGKW
jgi:hypothetical protein